MITPAEINALPQAARDYIADLETEADPAGTIRNNILIREENAMLRAHIAGSHNLGELQTIVHEWANEQFPHREPSIAWMKLFEELGEVIRDPSDALEWADVIILVLDLAAIYGVTSLDAAVIKKMTINRGRVWGTTATGVMKHVEGATPAPPLTEKRTIVVDAGPLFDVRTGGCPFEYDFPLADPVPPTYFYPLDGDPGSYVFVEETIGLGRRRYYRYKWNPEGAPI